jgi:hypothetical protein
MSITSYSETKKQKWVGVSKQGLGSWAVERILVEMTAEVTRNRSRSFEDFAENYITARCSIADQLLVIRFNHSQTSGAFLWETEAAGNSPNH